MIQPALQAFETATSCWVYSPLNDRPGRKSDRITKLVAESKPVTNTNERFATYVPHKPVSQALEEESGDSIIMTSWWGQTGCMSEQSGTTMGVVMEGAIQLSCETGVVDAGQKT